MQFNVVEVEKPSPILRKVTVRVPAQVVKDHIAQGLVAAQKGAKLKGFRPGQVPLSVVKQYYGEDVRHRVFHHLIDESFENAVREQKFKPVGSPKIDTPEHKTGEGSHDHTLKDDQDLTYIATFEILPELAIKKYTGVAVNREEVSITDAHIEDVVTNLHQSQAQLTPVEGGLALADGSTSSRPVQTGDFVDIQLNGGLVQDGEVVPRDDMKGNQMIEVGNATGWIPGFAEELIGLHKGEAKTFRLPFPADYSQAELQSKVAEFTVTVNEVKEKKLPVLDDEFAKQMGYEDLADIRTKAREYLLREKTENSDRQLRSDLMSTLIQDNAFEVPQVLIQSQMRALAQDLAQELKRQGYQEQAIQEVLSQELESLKTRAESQVRASLILEHIAEEEKIEVTSQDIDEELATMAKSMNTNLEKVTEFYAKNPGRKGDLEFRLRQERTVKFLLDKAKIKSVPPKEK